MLCGELGGHIYPHLNITATRNPYFSLLTYFGMANIAAEEDIYLENGLMSYENPNYHLPRLDDALNSNTELSTYRDLLYSELEAICRPPVTSNSRKAYATLDIGSMGVDLNTGPITNLDTDNIHHRNSSPVILDNNIGGNVNRGKFRPLDLTSTLSAAKPDLIEHSNVIINRNCDITLPNISGYDDEKEDYNVERSTLTFSNSDKLPPGWEQHQDNDGPYYWHIKSGTIQRNAPEIISGINEPRTPLVRDAETFLSSYHQTGGLGVVTRSNTSSALEEECKKREDKKEDISLKRRSYPARNEKDKEKPIRFAVRSLGWVDISEIDLTPERSSKAVNRCIVELSFGKNGLIDNVGRWGDGKDLFMDLDEGALKLIDPENLTVLNTQPIHTIRVWGVGRDNGRDFAYVARDRVTRKHMCHVFRCDIPARTIANTLRDICKKIMIERSLQQNLAKPIDTNGTVSSKQTSAVRPTNLPTEYKHFHRSPQGQFTQSFPTPMEEPKKVLVAQYLGNIEVSKASGIDVLNDAIDLLVNTVPKSQWQTVNIAVAPSMITISNADSQDNKPLVECRVRYLSFLGIGHNVKQCAFIMHTAQDLFIAHVFHCEPSSGALCKTVEAACKLRYQKCLDAHPQNLLTTDSKSPTKSISATLKSFVGSWTGRKVKKS
ncbi:protein Fe65 homolog [Halyomorpha halys]|uniref:protein Fe65 homolog n=1 Tax=Halyomorpha halys TaxID=286706 RepID=UPI0006D4CBB6|nr:protein Fe65 homolog isoform X2 [Halyomorpha halys]